MRKPASWTGVSRVTRPSECRQRYGKLDGGAGFGSRRKRQLLVHHRENASVRRIDHDGGAVHVAQRVDRGLANNRIFTRGDVARKDIALGKGTRSEALEETMTAMGKDCTAQFWRCRGCGRSPTSVDDARHVLWRKIGRSRFGVLARVRCWLEDFVRCTFGGTLSAAAESAPARAEIPVPRQKRKTISSRKSLQLWISCHASADWSRTSCPKLNQLSHALWQRYVRNVTLGTKFLLTTSTIPENLAKPSGLSSLELVFLKLTQNYTALSF